MMAVASRMARFKLSFVSMGPLGIVTLAMANKSPVVLGGESAQANSRACPVDARAARRRHMTSQQARCYPRESLGNKYICRFRAVLRRIRERRYRPLCRGRLVFIFFQQLLVRIVSVRPVCVVGAVGPNKTPFKFLFAGEYW